MIIFSPHALLKLNQRNISIKSVKETLKSPDYNVFSYSGREMAYKKFGKLYLKVVYKKEEKNVVVITQHWTEKPKLKK